MTNRPDGDSPIEVIDEDDQEITTEVAPRTKSQEKQVLRVKRLNVPEVCTVGAGIGDLLEIKYTTYLEDGTFLDASNRQIPGRGGDSSLYFVLGKQPTGQFPKGWDLGLVGMCVGEKRRLIVPPILAYGFKGYKRAGIPPTATVIYEIEVIGINGINLPR